MAQTVKCLPAMWETQVRSLGQEDPLVKEWQPTPVFLPGKFHGLRSLVGYSPWGCKESDMTERLHFHIRTYVHTYKVVLVVKNMPANAGDIRDMSSIPGSGGSPGGGHGNAP